MGPRGRKFSEKFCMTFMSDLFCLQGRIHCIWIKLEGNFFLPSNWSDWKEHGDTLTLCIIREEYSNGHAPIMICSYICYGVKKAFIRTYERMGVWTDERSTETIIFDWGVRKYFRVNAIINFDQFLMLLSITIIDHLLGSGSCKWLARLWLIRLPSK